ncbi:MAG: Asp-tRNA(Asn)/Glu-tRNA(Gln) amidotransferase subunit GatB [Saprospiraceae bacterium]
MSIYDTYETIIGLEVHVQLATKSKAFCADDTTFGADPNTHISVISLGHPGTLPKLNKRQVEFAVRLGLALNCEINPRNTFDRKNYFYADLPKGYQITQDASPICLGGKMEIRVGEEKKIIRLHHIHMEEDAGKLIHDIDPKHSLVDLNRAGVPLLEVVTEPDFRSAEEVDAFMNAMRQLVRYLEVSDGNMEEGSLRCDCNVSVRKKGDTQLNERCEIKNMNSMRYARQAIKFEQKRQIDLMEKGERVAQNTLNFDPATGTTSPLRQKEDAHDYRYFPEPDLPPVVLSKEYIEKIESEMPPLPNELFEKFKTEFQLPIYDANLLTEEKETALYFLEICKATKNYKAVSNLMINKIKPFCNEEKIVISELKVSPKSLAEFADLIESGKVSSSIKKKKLFPALISSPEKSPESLAQALNLIQSNDEDFLEKIVNEVLEKNPKEVEAYKKGKKNLIGFFMGQVMKSSKGKAEPKSTNALLRKKLEI